MAARHPPCRALKPKEKDYKVTDRDGMYVHVTAKGAMSFRMDCQPMSWLRSTMQPSRPSRNGHPISTAFRFRSGAKDPERNTLRNAVINWPDGDEGEKSGPADALDDDIDALARRCPPNALGEAFRGEGDDVFEAKLARLGGFRRAAGGRNHLAGALRPRELIGRVADPPADPRSQPRHAWLESGQRERDLRCQIGHWNAGRDDICDLVRNDR